MNKTTNYELLDWLHNRDENEIRSFSAKMYTAWKEKRIDKATYRTAEKLIDSFAYLGGVGIKYNENSEQRKKS